MMSKARSSVDIRFWRDNAGVEVGRPQPVLGEMKIDPDLDTAFVIAWDCRALDRAPRSVAGPHRRRVSSSRDLCGELAGLLDRGALERVERRSKQP